MKVKTSKGFTLAELLIVMAIIVVLAAVAIPTFGRQLETARETGDMEIIRAAYTEALSMAVLDASDGVMNGKNGGTNLGDVVEAEVTTTVPTVTITSFPSTTTGEVGLVCTYTVVLAKMDSEAKIKQTGAGWQYVNNQILGQIVDDVVSQKDTTTSYTQALSFKFKLESGTTGDGNVRLTAYTAPVTSGENTTAGVGIKAINAAPST